MRLVRFEVTNLERQVSINPAMVTMLIDRVDLEEDAVEVFVQGSDKPILVEGTLSQVERALTDDWGY